MKDIQAGPFFSKTGLTIRELKDLVASLPDATPDGQPFTVWVETGIGTSSQVKSVWGLNRGPDGCDIFFSPS